jgi:RHS repeat-associated protein
VKFPMGYNTGREEGKAGAPGITRKFTGLEQDAESGQNHTWFRQYSSAMGRWMTPDPAGLAAVNPANPQSWNRYAYVLNAPTELTDPLGLCPDGSPGPCQPDRDNIVHIINPLESGCMLEGAPWPCAATLGLLQAGAAAQCPNNNCDGVKVKQGPDDSADVFVNVRLSVPTLVCKGPSLSNYTCSPQTSVDWYIYSTSDFVCLGCDAFNAWQRAALAPVYGRFVNGVRLSAEGEVVLGATAACFTYCGPAISTTYSYLSAASVSGAAWLDTTFGAGTAYGTVQYFNGTFSPNSASSYNSIPGTLGALTTKGVQYLYQNDYLWPW